MCKLRHKNDVCVKILSTLDYLSSDKTEKGLSYDFHIWLCMHGADVHIVHIEGADEWCYSVHNRKEWRAITNNICTSYDKRRYETYS
ncbi:hypothetical protein AC249_AIPGENE26953 [Exaiptasia diaphana]|nr:hypothetical protein AC249_AIPGENE26953 [Exaiptasia diaphana]